MEKKKIILAVTGASGSVYADLLMKEIAKLEDQVGEAGIVFSKTCFSACYIHPICTG
jgi:4-hydroxy-3-polyprenylbenzoate decarboxylase